MKFLVKIALFVIFPSALLAQISDPFDWTSDLSSKKVSPGGEVPIEVQFLIPPKHYLYRDKMSLSIAEGGEGFQLSPLETSPSMKKKDPFTGKDEEIFEAGAVIKAKLSALRGAVPGDHSLKILLTYQGCSDQLCYRFMRRELDLSVQVSHAASVEEPSSWRVGGGADFFKNKSFLWILLVTFLGGIGSAFTPCVLPVIPITLAFIGVRKTEDKLLKNFFYSFLLVFSMSLSYAVMGLLAASFGRSLGFLFQNPYFLLIGVVLFLTFSLSLFGLFEIQMPLAFRNRIAKLGGAGALGSVLSGLTIGFLAAPCVGPLIASLLLYVAHTRDLLKGFILLFVYGLGMGSLFLLIGTYYHRLASRIHGGRYTVWVERFFAVLLLIPAAYYGHIAWQHFQKSTVERPAQSMPWIRDATEGFEIAKREGRPMFVDFFASWCFPCVQMEKSAFSDPALQKFLTERFVPIKVDCTEETPQCKRMVDRYGVVGWPTFLVLSPQGEVLQTFVGKSFTAPELREALIPYFE